MPMAEKKPVPVDFQYTIFHQDGEIQEFLVAVPVTVSPDGNDFILPAIEPCRSLLTGSATVQSTLPPTKKNIAEQHQFVGGQFLAFFLQQCQAVR